jgi:hypothetical protein
MSGTPPTEKRHMSDGTVTAAILVIGDEILSGRTKDKNIGYIAEYLTKLGIDLREVRIVPDVEAEIVAALNALRTRYDYVFTTGGIGPTHDDITADCVAKAFGVGSTSTSARSPCCCNGCDARTSTKPGSGWRASRTGRALSRTRSRARRAFASRTSS